MDSDVLHEVWIISKDGKVSAQMPGKRDVRGGIGERNECIAVLVEFLNGSHERRCAPLDGLTSLLVKFST
jgi:hypothetical protein